MKHYLRLISFIRKACQFTWEISNNVKNVLRKKSKMTLSGFEYILNSCNKKVLLLRIYGLNPTEYIDLSSTIPVTKWEKSLLWLQKKLLFVNNMLIWVRLHLPSAAAQFVAFITAPGRKVTERGEQMNIKEIPWNEKVMVTQRYHNVHCSAVAN